MSFSPFFRTRALGLAGANDVTDQSLTEEDQLFVLTQTGMYLTATRGHSAPEARLCHERVESCVIRWIAPASLFCADRSGAPFSPDRPAEDSYADRPTCQSPGQGAEQLCVSGWELATLGRHNLLFERFSVCATIRDARRSADKSSPTEEVSAPAVSCLCYFDGSLRDCSAKCSRTMGWVSKRTTMAGVCPCKKSCSS